MLHSLRRYGFFQYGQVVPGLELYGRPAPHPVLNERAIRAGAGLMFAAGFFAFFQAFYLSEYLYLQVFVSLFFFDFLMKVVVGTRFSPIGRLAGWIVRGQQPEYVGAVQKRFAWSIGLVLSSLMLVLIFGFGIIGIPNLIICSVCLVFMFMESAFGVCVGCKMYSFLLAKNIIKTPVHKPVCAGNSCALPE